MLFQTIVPDFFTLTLIIFLAILHGRASRMGTLSMVLLRLPSTLLHELAHLAAALITFAGPTDIDISPRRAGGGGWVLGCVKCNRITWYNAFWVGLAPLAINLPLAWWVHQRQTLGGYVMAFLLLTAALPSNQDVRVAFHSVMGAMVWIGLGVVVAAGFGGWW